MDTLIQIYRDGDWFVAIDLATNVADQGKTKEEAISRLKKGLQEHYAVLLEVIDTDRSFETLTVEVPVGVNSSRPLIA
ncbi:MAG: type II toxin-antitoxin system HicB family antitoxin [Methanospirillaceae archaeon]|nr:type II toxin-antitoxin system HicB family antitoxin [Methanospirillaceae archaeon]